ncbi:MAG: FimB/Mfa2 family fimbrial subunit [Rikenellaceae bacterium]|nr:FimB/Mfa2 family fimbrial subunit [Rikenellaceae bacterium]MCL2691877.1 FimB/Mfa2 family fimbrial subunit [Rikenellaceae bacterium]
MNTAERNRRKAKQRGARRTCRIGGITYLSFCLFILFLATGGCDIWDKDPATCPAGIDVRFHSQSPCGENELPSITGIRLYVFGADGTLVTVVNDDTAVLSADYVKRVYLPRNGIYTTLAWVGLNMQYCEIEAVTVGTTTCDDVLLHLRRAAEQAVPTDGMCIYFGGGAAVDLATMPPCDGGIFAEVRVNILEVTNRVTVEIDGVSAEYDYEVAIESANGMMTIDGACAPDDMVWYTPVSQTVDGVLESRFTLLRLDSDIESVLVVRDRADGTEVYRAALLDELLLLNPFIDLACNHDFHILLKVRGSLVVEARVNNWLVHSYETDL